LNGIAEILRNIALGLLAGIIYVWPFAASKSYKRLISSGVRDGRRIALFQKIVSMIVAVCVALAAIIVVRAFSTRALAWVDFLAFLASVAISGLFAWRYLYRANRD
jgi:hypothetical protein